MKRLTATPSSTAAQAAPLSAVPGALKHEIGLALAVPFPVLASTCLCLDLLRDRSSIDLQALADLLGRDLGAMLRLFALIANEFPNPGDRPERLEDCIASLSTHDLLRHLRHPHPSREEQLRLAPFAHHSFRIAGYARVVASSLGLCAERAYLVGLFHALGSLPSELGRLPPISESTALAVVASAIAHHYQLPKDLSEALQGVHSADSRSVWLATIQAAHDLATVPSGATLR